MICNGCGGVVGRDCFNPQECEWIATQMEMQSDIPGQGQCIENHIRSKVNQLAAFFVHGMHDKSVPKDWIIFHKKQYEVHKSNGLSFYDASKTASADLMKYVFFGDPAEQLPF